MEGVKKQAKSKPAKKNQAKSGENTPKEVGKLLDAVSVTVVKY
jgi:hypothetical protein